MKFKGMLGFIESGRASSEKFPSPSFRHETFVRKTVMRQNLKCSVSDPIASHRSDMYGKHKMDIGTKKNETADDIRADAVTSREFHVTD
jgi:hypothetical protein